MTDTSQGQAEDQHRPGWRTTHWSVVLAAARGASPQAKESLEKLCQTYWYPLYAYIRRRGYDVPEAQDLTQEFFAHLLEEHWLEHVDRSKGRFRSFLLAALNHLLANEWDRSHAAKRGGGRALVSLDATGESRYAREPACDLTPERLYERRWAMSLFERALDRLREQYQAAGKARQYDCLNEFLSKEAGDGEYLRAGAQLEMSTGAVSTAVHRLRQSYRALVREEVARTVASQAEVDDEVRSLLAALS
jgi:RNA polymerase sigma-70 factor (ECF subfamily)